jgi:hypothetical protein
METGKECPSTFCKNGRVGFGEGECTLCEGHGRIYTKSDLESILNQIGELEGWVAPNGDSHVSENAIKQIFKQFGIV